LDVEEMARLDVVMRSGRRRISAEIVRGVCVFGGKGRVYSESPEGEDI